MGRSWGCCFGGVLVIDGGGWGGGVEWFSALTGGGEVVEAVRNSIGKYFKYT